MAVRPRLLRCFAAGRTAHGHLVSHVVHHLCAIQTYTASAIRSSHGRVVLCLRATRRFPACGDVNDVLSDPVQLRF